MQWLLEHFQIVIIVALAFASWLKSRMDARREEQETYDPRSEGRDEDETTWDPPNAYPPPVSVPRVPPPLPTATPAPWNPPPWSSPPLVPSPAASASAEEAEAVLRHQQELAERLRQIRETRATTTGGAAATRARVAREKSVRPAVAVAGGIAIAQRLRDPRELRRAFITREILDRPVGLR